MQDIAWTVFLLISVAVIAAPGQDLILVMTRGLARGPRAGFLTAGGVSCGLVGHSLLAALGLGALLTAAEWSFVVMKIVGAAYLFYLGIRLLRAGAPNLEKDKSSDSGPLRLFVEGALSNLSNPKIALFYFAFLPQFLTKEPANPTLSIFIMGLAFALLTFVMKAPVGLFAGALSGWIMTRPRVVLWIHRVSGLSLLAMGLRLVFEDRS